MVVELLKKYAMSESFCPLFEDNFNFHYLALIQYYCELSCESPGPLP